MNNCSTMSGPIARERGGVGAMRNRGSSNGHVEALLVALAIAAIGVAFADSAVEKVEVLGGVFALLVAGYAGYLVGVRNARDH